MTGLTEYHCKIAQNKVSYLEIKFSVEIFDEFPFSISLLVVAASSSISRFPLLFIFFWCWYQVRGPSIVHLIVFLWLVNCENEFSSKIFIFKNDFYKIIHMLVVPLSLSTSLFTILKIFFICSLSKLLSSTLPSSSLPLSILSKSSSDRHHTLPFFKYPIFYRVSTIFFPNILFILQIFNIRFWN